MAGIRSMRWIEIRTLEEIEQRIEEQKKRNEELRKADPEVAAADDFWRKEFENIRKG
ncbi:MAG: hypothetical protein J5617_03925 [Bacilli bacterium]|nr:hypothetical protein [Bacilli bacterium]